jgi:hypothetical protein
MLRGVRSLESLLLAIKYSEQLMFLLTTHWPELDIQSCLISRNQECILSSSQKEIEENIWLTAMLTTLHGSETVDSLDRGRVYLKSHSMCFSEQLLEMTLEWLEIGNKCVKNLRKEHFF